ncbi:histidine kinase [Crinalium epipsammum PCC 9333]|uniref:Histidine kinase n=1 Tax=Crinalium epipsammum PCC 9333 TaxID=1173022 RepID=K9VWV7_9CYAN|nr:ATP-binding protein [Crinalium epipsammum]AFZ12573.1 histidine kinase [Crinalium epipsammum PCC 9333]
MIPPYVSLSPALLAKLFPFHIAFNKNTEIVQAGEVLQRIAGESLVGSQLEQHFQIARPRVKIDFDAIKKQSRSLFLLESLHNGMQLKGQMVYVEEQEVIFFLCSLWVTETETLGTLNVKLRDFAIHDPIVDFLFLLQAKDTALTDAKKLTEELTQQQEELNSALQMQAELVKTAEAQAQKLEKAMIELRQTQAQLIQTEKMSSLGQLVAGVAHEINNPISFIQGNIKPANEYIQDLLDLLQLYQEQYADVTPEISEKIEEIELDFLMEDLPKLISSMEVGAERIAEIVKSLRNFSRLDEAEIKPVDIHSGIESTLMILHNRLKATSEHSKIEVVKEYGDLPPVECYAGQLNQVFMNIIANAIDAVEESILKLPKTERAGKKSAIAIRTEVVGSDRVAIRISDNGLGMPETVQTRLFDPFFTTKPVGKGTGLGMSISYQIVAEKHNGSLQCISTLGEGTEFVIEIPIQQPDLMR